MTLCTRATTGRARDPFAPVHHGSRRVAKRGAAVTARPDDVATRPDTIATVSRHGVTPGVASRVTPGVTTGLHSYNYGID